MTIWLVVVGWLIVVAVASFAIGWVCGAELARRRARQHAFPHEFSGKGA